MNDDKKNSPSHGRAWSSICGYILSFFTRWKIRRRQKQSAALAAQIAEEKRLHQHSRKLASLSIYQLRRIVRRQPNYRLSAEAELSRRLLRNSALRAPRSAFES